jgi:hypothetical protein
MQNSNYFGYGAATVLPPERSRLATFLARNCFVGFASFVTNTNKNLPFFLVCDDLFVFLPQNMRRYEMNNVAKTRKHVHTRA